MNGGDEHFTVFIVAASAIARAGLETVLRTDERLIIAGSAAEISAALPGFSSDLTVDILLVNVEQQREFADLIEFLNDEGVNSPPPVALLSSDFQNLEQEAIRLLQNGAGGILSNNATAGEIAAAIVAAANGLIVAPPEVLETLFAMVTIENSLPDRERYLPEETIENLTAREREVLEFLVEGESNKAIAYRLNISEHTVKFHVASIFGKLRVNTRTEAVTVALRRGLILL